MDMPGTAGSDAHARSDIARVATDFERDIRDIFELIEELNAGRFSAVDLTVAARLSQVEAPSSSGSA